MAFPYSHYGMEDESQDTQPMAVDFATPPPGASGFHMIAPPPASERCGAKEDGQLQESWSPAMFNPKLAEPVTPGSRRGQSD